MIQAIYRCEDLFKTLTGHLHRKWWPLIGVLVIGLGGPLLLFFVKMVSWSAGLGGGTSWGILDPILLMGGSTGGSSATGCPAAPWGCRLREIGMATAERTEFILHAMPAREKFLRQRSCPVPYETSSTTVTDSRSASRTTSRSPTMKSPSPSTYCVEPPWREPGVSDRSAKLWMQHGGPGSPGSGSAWSWASRPRHRSNVTGRCPRPRRADRQIDSARSLAEAAARSRHRGWSGNRQQGRETVVAVDDLANASKPGRAQTSTASSTRRDDVASTARRASRRSSRWT